jgi:hypothetical protein
MNKKEGFAYFGAEPKNERWSWAATTPHRDRVVITLWTHELQGQGVALYYDTRELGHTCWQEGQGNKERIKLLKHAQDNLDSVLYVLMCKAKDKDKKDKEIEEVYPWASKTHNHRMKLTFFDSATGDYRVEYLDSVPKE